MTSSVDTRGSAEESRFVHDEEPAPRGRARRDTNADEDGPHWHVEGVEQPESAPPEADRPRFSGRAWRLILILLAVNLVLAMFLGGGDGRTRIPYTVFVEQVDANNVAEVTSRGEDIQGVFTTPITYPADGDEVVERFNTERPSFAQDDLLARLTANAGMRFELEPASPL